MFLLPLERVIVQMGCQKLALIWSMRCTQNVSSQFTKIHLIVVLPKKSSVSEVDSGSNKKKEMQRKTGVDSSIMDMDSLCSVAVCNALNL